MKLLRRKPPSHTSEPARRRGVVSPAREETSEQYTFRRNRTITGSLSSGVTSAAVKNADLRSPRQHAHDLRRHRRNLRLLLVGAATAAVLIGVLLYNMTASVVVVADTTLPIDQRLYAAKINDYLSAHPLGRFRFALDTESLATYLQEHDSPEVESVSEKVEYAGFGASQFVLAMRRPAAVWRSGSAQVYVDTDGHTFSRHYYAEPRVEVVDESGISTRNNRVLASNRFLAVMGMMIGRANHYGLTATRITLPAGATRQIHISFEGVSYPVKYSVDRGVGEQMEDAYKAIQFLAGQGINPQYLDVRVSGKAYYQ